MINWEIIILNKKENDFLFRFVNEDWGKNIVTQDLINIVRRELSLNILEQNFK